jgi:hypothetical protein
MTEDQIKQTVMNTVDQVYNMDTIRNLGAISKSILTGKNYHNMSGTATPGNLTIPANTIIDGDTTISGDTTNDTNGTELTFDMSEFSDIVSNNSIPFGGFNDNVIP